MAFPKTLAAAWSHYCWPTLKNDMLSSVHIISWPPFRIHEPQHLNFITWKFRLPSSQRSRSITCHSQHSRTFGSALSLSATLKDSQDIHGFAHWWGTSGPALIALSHHSPRLATGWRDPLPGRLFPCKAIALFATLVTVDTHLESTLDEGSPGPSTTASTPPPAFHMRPQIMVLLNASSLCPGTDAVPPKIHVTSSSSSPINWSYFNLLILHSFFSLYPPKEINMPWFYDLEV